MVNSDLSGGMIQVALRRPLRFQRINNEEKMKSPQCEETFTAASHVLRLSESALVTSIAKNAQLANSLGVDLRQAGRLKAYPETGGPLFGRARRLQTAS